MKRLLVLNLIMLATVCGCSPNDNATADNAVTVNAVAAQAVAEEKSAVSTSNSSTTSTSDKVAKVAAECSACHNNMIDLSDVPADELVAAISDIIATKKPHPTAVPELTTEQLGELAALLRKP